MQVLARPINLLDVTVQLIELKFSVSDGVDLVEDKVYFMHVY